ncbi:hypothetical protein C8R47DRAFT_1066638 [Mycena vitilis]|nr:hypothetical protein C8R47DRAFT_1066638 [Mycena vitilis]
MNTGTANCTEQPSIEPRLPPELECTIFETTAESLQALSYLLSCIPELMLIAQRAKHWRVEFSIALIFIRSRAAGHYLSGHPSGLALGLACLLHLTHVAFSTARPTVAALHALVRVNARLQYILFFAKERVKPASEDDRPVGINLKRTDFQSDRIRGAAIGGHDYWVLAEGFIAAERASWVAGRAQYAFGDVYVLEHLTWISGVRQRRSAQIPTLPKCKRENLRATFCGAIVPEDCFPLPKIDFSWALAGVIYHRPGDTLGYLPQNEIDLNISVAGTLTHTGSGLASIDS